MSVSSANVKVGVTGSVSVAPLGTALPTAPETTLNVAFDELGYVSPDGVTEAMDSSTSKITAWQNGDTVREIQTEQNLTYAFTAIETNPVVLEEFYGNFTAGVVEVNANQPAPKRWVIDVLDGDDIIRIVLPYAQVTERGDIVYVNGDPIGYPFIVTAYGDPDYAGSETAPAKAYKYLYVVGSIT